MQIIYFDEVKYEKGKQPYFWLGGIAVDASKIQETERLVDDLSEQYFGNRLLSRVTEFHASDIKHKTNHFKHETNYATRRALLEKLADIIDSENITTICVRIDTGKMRFKTEKECEKLAFMYFTEQADVFLKSKNEIGMLIGDRDTSSIAQDFAEALSHYRNNGTSYYYGRKLEKLIDTVHFSESHLSRMLQLADAYVWLKQFYHQNRVNPSKYSKELVTHLSNKTKIVSSSFVKAFP